MMPTAVRMPDLATHHGPHGLTITASALATVPLVQAHLAIPLVLRDRFDLAVCDVLAACWPDLPACTYFEQFGGTVAISRKRQWLILSLTCTADLLPLLADTLAAVVGAQYTDDRVRIASSKAGQQASLVTAQPAADSARRLWGEFYEQPPPFADPSPDPDDVAEVSARQVAAAHSECISPGRSQLVVVGDIDEERTFDCLERALSVWIEPPLAAREDTTGRPARAAGYRIVTHHRPGWQQSHIRLAAESISRTNRSGFAAAQIASLILGGAFSSRINAVLREEHGLAYRALASVTDHLDDDVLVIEADVSSSGTAEAMSHLARLLEEFAAAGPTDREREAAIGYITGKHALSLGSQGGRAACVLSYLTSGIPASGIADILERIARLTHAEVRAAAALYGPDRMSGVVCGNATELPDRWF
ncbi:M16 family metallopeptidase [Streptomyces sp. NPDC057623]|uniref:M16 family metallopeptidase n=1 Tax=Streptomyces sp. NPDC057623 TaxID=3346187 RepID=UPI0036C438D8